MDKFKVTIKNEILGDSESIKTMEEIKKFNVCALMCAEKSQETVKPCSIGMWTVEII